MVNVDPFIKHGNLSSLEKTIVQAFGLFGGLYRIELDVCIPKWLSSVLVCADGDSQNALDTSPFTTAFEMLFELVNGGGVFDVAHAH